MAKMTFASVYPRYIIKIENKGKTKEELHHVIEWLTGFDDKKMQVGSENSHLFVVFLSEGRDTTY